MNPLEAYANTLVLSDIHPEDLACIRNIAAKGIPVVTLLVSGRPLIVNEELDASAAFVASWLPGAEGRGVAEMLMGDYEFAGRLPTSWPGPEHKDGLLPRTGAAFSAGFGLTLQAATSASRRGSVETELPETSERVRSSACAPDPSERLRP